MLIPPLCRAGAGGRAAGRSARDRRFGALVVLAAFLVVQQVEGNVLQPLIMGHALRLHPIVVLLAVASAGLLGGIAGAVAAVPVVAVTSEDATGGHLETHDGDFVVDAAREGAVEEVRLRGELDLATAPLLRGLLDGVYARRPQRVEVDLSAVPGLDTPLGFWPP